MLGKQPNRLIIGARARLMQACVCLKSGVMFVLWWRVGKVRVVVDDPDPYTGRYRG